MMNCPTQLCSSWGLGVVVVCKQIQVVLHRVCMPLLGRGAYRQALADGRYIFIFRCERPFFLDALDNDNQSVSQSNNQLSGKHLVPQSNNQSVTQSGRQAISQSIS